MGKSSINGLFSMAMLNNQRVVNMLSIETHWDPPVQYGALSESHNHKTNT